MYHYWLSFFLHYYHLFASSAFSLSLSLFLILPSLNNPLTCTRFFFPSPLSLLFFSFYLSLNYSFYPKTSSSYAVMTTTRDRQLNSGLNTNTAPTKSTSTKSMSSSSTNIVGVHYRVGKKVGEGSFGVLYEGIFYIPHSATMHSIHTMALYRHQSTQQPVGGYQV